MVESSFSEMRNVGRKRHLGNGILQRLGIDDEQPIHHFSTSKTENAKKTSPFDFLRCSTTWKRRKSNVDADVRADKDDVDSEGSDVERTVGGSNPLFALKELCNNTNKTTMSTTGRRTKTSQNATKSDDSNGRSSSLSSSSSSEISSPKNSEEKLENAKNVDDDNNGVVKRSIEPQLASSEDENDDEKVGITKSNKKTGIRVKNAKELLRTRRNRIPRNEVSHGDANNVAKTSQENVAGSESSSQSATEAKFFRYSELAKVLAAGN